MLQVSHLHASFDGKPALADISLTLNDGELLVVLGPSGCGKTTLLNLIAGFLPVETGNITLDGRAVTGPGADRGVVFQHEGLLPWRSVLDNVAFGLQLQGVGREERRALAADPQLLLLDEPFGALDAFTREQMQTLLLRLWAISGKKVLLITHDIEEAVFMATDLVLLSPVPGRVQERLSLDFARRFVAGEPARAIKSDPAFIARREYVLSRVFELRESVYERTD
ncbi:ATP-binding cassette domain-containing protein [Cronobacter sakazakii]